MPKASEPTDAQINITKFIKSAIARFPLGLKPAAFPLIAILSEGSPRCLDSY
jgi:hypothetical protein